MEECEISVKMEKECRKLNELCLNSDELCWFDANGNHLEFYNGTVGTTMVHYCFQHPQTNKVLNKCMQMENIFKLNVLRRDENCSRIVVTM